MQVIVKSLEKMRRRLFRDLNKRVEHGLVTPGPSRNQEGEKEKLFMTFGMY